MWGSLSFFPWPRPKSSTRALSQQDLRQHPASLSCEKIPRAAPRAPRLHPHTDILHSYWDRAQKSWMAWCVCSAASTSPTGGLAGQRLLRCFRSALWTDKGKKNNHPDTHTPPGHFINKNPVAKSFISN